MLLRIDLVVVPERAKGLARRAHHAKVCAMMACILRALQVRVSGVDAGAVVVDESVNILIKVHLGKVGQHKFSTLAFDVTASGWTEPDVQSLRESNLQKYSKLQFVPKTVGSGSPRWNDRDMEQNEINMEDLRHEWPQAVMMIINNNARKNWISQGFKSGKLLQSVNPEILRPCFRPSLFRPASLACLPVSLLSL